MKVIVAKPCGFCYGVKRAVRLAEEAAKRGVHGATLGPLIHNPQFVQDLAAQGIDCKKGRIAIRRSRTVAWN